MEEKQPEKDDILKKKQPPTKDTKGVQIPPRPLMFWFCVCVQRSLAPLFGAKYVSVLGFGELGC
jgi:hypothetical protein